MHEPSPVLVVDGHNDTLFALESTLEQLRYPLLRACGTSEALKVLLHAHPAVILLNVGTDSTGELDLVHRMRRLDPVRDVPVVLLSSTGSERDLSALGYRLAVADLVLMPVDPWVLRIKVRHLYETQVALRALRRAAAPVAVPSPTADSDSGVPSGVHNP
ncbi:response regulator [Streptomyces sp. S.PB5]|uniref:response regulator n=1 Tax=Streptomyces sp. S.PB5 TaxID=3020844 RepID=UPI0025B09856|nr:response regulator [Streptomyces sp. S.PB5]MDN3022804.1 response regulator [Streptomyces sp. S.PB5]